MSCSIVCISSDVIALRRWCFAAGDVASNVPGLTWWWWGLVGEDDLPWKLDAVRVVNTPESQSRLLAIVRLLRFVRVFRCIVLVCM